MNYKHRNKSKNPLFANNIKQNTMKRLLILSLILVNSMHFNAQNLSDGPGNAAAFTGSGSRVLRAPHSEDLSFGNQSFTVEAWINTNDYTTSEQTIIAKRDFSLAGPYANYSLRFREGKLFFFFRRLNGVGGLQQVVDAAPTITNNSWNHVAGVFDISDSTMMIFINGQLRASEKATITPDVVSSPFSIGNTVNGGGYSFPFDGEIDEVRISNVARYTSNFSSNETPFIVDENTVGYWDMNQTNVDSIRDASSYHHDLAMLNSPTLATSDADLEIHSGNAVRFDGTQKYFSVGDDASINFGASDDFTFEGWFNTSTSTGVQTILRKNNSGTGYALYIDNGYLHGIVSDGTNSDTVKSMSIYNDGLWHYYAFARDAGNTIKLYIDGEEVDSETDNTSDLSNTDSLLIGSDKTTAHFNGYLDEIRLSTTGRSINSVPTSEFMSDANTVALYHFNITGTYSEVSDKSSQSNILYKQGDITLTSNNLFALQLSMGDFTPEASNEANDASNIPILQFELFATTASDITINSISFSNSGTADESVAISTGGVKVYRDNNNNGVIDISDDLIGTGSPPASDNGKASVNIGAVVNSGTSQVWLLAYNLDGAATPASNGETFIASLIPADINANDESSDDINPVGSTLTSNTKTISSTPSLDIYLGADNPASQNIQATDSSLVVMQFTAEASSASYVDISDFTIRENGTADIDATIDSVRLILDKNSNGSFDDGVDSLVAKSVDPSSSPISLTPSSSYRVPVATAKNFLIVYSISGASNGDNYTASINAGDLTSAGTDITGLPINGNTFTVASAGTLAVSLGSNNPGASNVSNAAQNISMLQLKLQNNNIEKIALESIKLTAIGSMDADTTVTSVELYHDVNGNGSIDLANEPKIGNSQSFSSNVTTFSSLNDTLELNEIKYILVVYNLNGKAPAGSNFSVSVSTNVDVGITGLTSGSAEVTGMPLSGNNMTISSYGTLTISASENNPVSRTEINDAVEVGAISVNLAASSAEDIAVNSITFRGTGTGSFSDDITENSIELYKDNGDGVYDAVDDQLIGIGKKFESQALTLERSSNQYVLVPDHSSLDLTNQLTIEAWVKPASIPGGDMQILNKESTYEIAVRNGYLDAAIETNASGAWFWCTGGYSNILTGSGLTGDPKNEFNYYNTSLGRVAEAVDELPQMVADQWYHVAVTFDGNAYRVFQDGELLYTIRKDGSGTPIAGTIINSTSNVNIGRRPSGHHFDGEIDELHLSDAVRYTEDFTTPTFPYTPDQQTALLLHFDEGSGTTATDASVYQNDGTLQNSASWVTSTSPIADKLVSINTTGQVISAGSSADWLLIYDYNGNGDNGEDYTTKVTRALDVSAVGQTSSSTITPNGSYPVTGGTITLSNTGNLTIAEGTNNPNASSVNSGAQGVAMMQMRVTASSAEDITVNYLGIKSDGTGDDNTDIDSIYIYKDENKNGIYNDLVDTRIAAGGPFIGDDDSLRIYIDYTLTASSTEHWLIVYDYNTNPSNGEAFSVSIPLDEYVEATGVSSASPVNVTGASIDGNEKTISTIGNLTLSVGDNTIGSSNEAADATNLNMAQFNFAAGASEGINITGMSFKDAGSADITTDVTEARLHRDINGNGLVDPGDPIIGTTTDFGADFGNAITLNGSDQYVSIPDDNSLDISGSFTIEAWIYPKTLSGNQVIIAKRDESGNNEPNYELRIEDEDIRFFFRDGNDDLFQVLTDFSPLTVDEWQVISATYDGNYMRLFRNGIKIDSTEVLSKIPQVNDKEVTIGFENYWSTSYYFDGYIDEVRISDIARYTTDFDKPTAPFSADANTLALYHFNESGGASVSDASSNNNDGTTQNSPSFTVNDEFSVKANFSGLSETIAATEDKDYILVYDLNGNAEAGETFRAKINANADITATGQTSGQPVKTLGAPATGNTKTIAETGSFTIDVGDNNPGPKTITKDAQKVSMLQIKITTSSTEAIDIATLEVNTIGTGHDVDNLNATAGIELYVDANANGLYDNGIDQFLGQGVYDENDGAAILSASNRRIAASTTEHWLVVQNYNNTADSGLTFTTRVLSPSDFSATGSNSGQNITPSGSALIGGTLTISTLGSITISLGNLSPDDSYITNDAINVEMMQLQLQTSAAEAAYIKTLKFKASGTGDDTADIVADSVELWHDLNDNGELEQDIDTLLDLGNYTADNGLVIYDFDGDSLYLEANSITNVLLSYDMDTSATDNETFKATVELNNYIEAYGINTTQQLPVTGAAVEGAIKTISSIGTLTLTLPSTNPSASNETNDAQGVVMMVFRLSASDAEDIRVDSVIIGSEGTLIENNSVTSVQLFKDLNNNGELDLTIDPQSDSTRFFSSDNGTITFTTINDTLTAGSFADYLVIYNMAGVSGPDSTFRTKITNNTKVIAKGLNGSEHDVTITGAPIYGNYKTITNSGSLTLSEGDYNIQPSNITIDAESVPMAQVKLTASSAENIAVNNIVLRAGGSFSPKDDVAAYGIELYQDMNNNGTIDDGVDEFISSAEKFGSYAIDFDGSTGYVEVPHSSSLNLDGSGLTMEGWFYAERTSGSNIIVNKERTYEVAVNNGELQAAVETTHGNAWFWTSGPEVTANTWHHFAVTYDGTAIRVYLDGTLGSTTTTNTGGDIDPSVNSLMIARRPLGGGSYFQGKIDDIRLSDIARYTGDSYTVPTTAYNSDVNTIALYSFDEKSGTAVLDKSTNNNNGTLNGTADRVESTAGFSSNTVSIETTGQIIDQGSSENWIARLSFNGNATVGEDANITISSNDVSATGVSTENNIDVDGTSVSGGTQTFSNSGSLTLSGNGPSAGNISKSSQQQPMLVLILTAGNAEDVEISEFQFKASGSGNDATAIDSIEIWEDLNKNNVIDIGIDRLITSGADFSTNDGIITEAFTTPEVIDAESNEQWIVAYDFAGTAANNDQFQTGIELSSYVTAEGATTGSSITPSLPGGTAIRGGVQTVKTIGQLVMEVGDDNPSTTTVENTAEYHVFLQAKFTANPADTILIDTLSIAEKGTVDESTAFTEVSIYLDGDNNGLLDFVNDIDLGEGTRIGNNFRFTSLGQEIEPNQSKNYLVVATLNGSAPENKTIQFEIPLNDSVKAIGKNSGLYADVIGAPVTGTLITVKNIGTLTMVPGDNNPVDGNIVAGSDEVPMMQIKITGSDVEDIETNTFTFTAQGTGNDVTAIDTGTINLYKDVNNDGAYQSEIDIFIGNGKAYNADNGTVTVSTNNRIIHKNESEYWLLTYDFNGTPVDGNTFRARILEDTDIDAVGVTSSEDATISLPEGVINGSLRTINSIGSLSLALGANTPVNSTIANDDQEVVMMQLRLVASESENIQVSDATLKASGTGDDNTDIADIHLYLDINNNGTLDDGVDTLILSAGTAFDNDNDTIKFDFAEDYTIEAGSTIHWLVVYDFAGAATDNSTFISSVELNSYFNATGETSGESISVVGSPITSYTKTVSSIGTMTFELGDDNPPVANQTKDAQGVRMMQVKASLNGTEDLILDSLVITAQGTIDDATDITSVAIYKDLNDNGLLDLTVDEQLDQYRTFSSDNGTLAFEEINDTLSANTTAHYLVIFNLANTASAGETFRVKIESNNDFNVKRVGVDENANTIGAPLLGNYQAITNEGQLYLSEGSSNPGPGNITNDAQKVSMLQMNIAASSVENVEVNTITLRSGGTIDEEEDIENYGINLYDDVNNNGAYDAGIDNYIASSQGFVNQAISLENASTQYLEAPNSTSLSLNGSEMTMECWVYLTSSVSDWRYIINKEYTYELAIASGNRLNVAIETSSPRGWFWSYQVGVEPVIPVGQWTHVAVSFNGTDFRVFVDGDLKGTITQDNNGYAVAGTITPSNNPLHIGRRDIDPGDEFNGYIDELRISNKARYADDFAVQSAEFGVDNYTMALYHLNEEDGSTTFYDVSGNNNNATAFNNPSSIASTAPFAARSLNLITEGQVVQAGQSKNWIITYDFAGIASDGETVYSTISREDISAEGATSGNAINISGNNVTGGQKTFSDLGSLTLTALGPNPGTIGTDDENAVMMRLQLTASDADTLNVSKLKIKGNGSGDESSIVAKLYLWDDLNNNGNVDPGIDNLLDSIPSSPFSSDNGIATYDFTDDKTIPKGESKYWLITYNYSGGTHGETYQARMELNSYMEVTGTKIVQPITPTAAGSFPIYGGTQTVSNLGQLTVENGNNTPPSGNVDPSATDVVVYQMKFSANNSENIAIDTITIKQTGTIDISSIDTVKLFKDKDNNGQLSYVNDEFLTGAVKNDPYFRFENVNDTIGQGNFTNYLIVMTLDNATQDETIKFSVPANDSVKATGVTSQENVNIIGSPIYSHTKTVQNIGNVIITAGESNPPDNSISGTTEDAPMIQLKLETSNVEDVEVSSISFHADGSGHDMNDITSNSIKLFKDANENGQLDGTDVFLQTASAYSADNGSVTLNLNSVTLLKNTTTYWILVQSFNGNGSNGDSYRTRFIEADDITLTGITSEENITPQITQAVNGGLQTISEVGVLTFATGNNNPSSGYVANLEEDIPMLQVKMITGEAEDVYINKFTVKANGTATDQDGISEVYLVDDLNNNGAYDTGVDTTLTGIKTFDSDNDTIHFLFSGPGKLLPSGNTSNWLVLYSLSDQNANGETMIASIELNSYITATGATSTENISPLGAPITGNTKTLSSDGAATLTIGDNNPLSDDFGKSEINLVVMQFNISASAADDLLFDGVTFNAGGTLDEPDDIISAYVYHDGNSDGEMNIGVDYQLGSSSVYSSDNGTITFTDLEDTIYQNSSKDYLLVYNLSGNASGGETFSASIQGNDQFVVKQTDGSDAIKLGAPISSNTHTVSSTGILTLSTGSQNPSANYVLNDDQNISMVQFNLAANTDEDIRINSLAVTSTGSFDPRDDILENGIVLYKDENNNGTVDEGSDVILGSAPGFVGYDLNFSASSTEFAYTTSSGSDPIDNYSDQFTMEAWIYPVSHSGNDIVINKENGYEIGINGNNLAVAIHIGGTWAWDISTPITYDQWHHVAATFDGSNIKLWMDGELKGTYNRPGTISKNSNPIKIGGRSTSTTTCTSPFSGNIDEVRLSNTVRYSGSSYQVPETEFVADANTLALWHINEGTGSTLTDASASGSNMAIVGGIWEETTNTISSEKVTIDIAGGSIINAGTNENWLIAYDLSGNASAGETMASTIEKDFINAKGLTSQQILSAQGESSVTGGLKTIAEKGTLELSIVGPDAKKESGEISFTTFILDLKAGSSEGIHINSFKIHSTGTVHDVDNIEGVYLYHDVNKNSMVETGGPDTLLFSSVKQFSSNNGTITWSFAPAVSIDTSSTQRWIVYYDMDETNPPANGKTIQVALELESYVNAEGEITSESITPTFAGGLEFPQSAGIITISDVGSLSIEEGTNNAGFTNEQTNGTNVLMLALKLATNASEPVLVNSIEFATEFAGNPVGSNGSIADARLYKDANDNAEYDVGVDTEIDDATVNADGSFTFAPASPVQVDSASSEEWFVVFDFAASEGELYTVKFLGSEYADVEGLMTEEAIIPQTGMIQGGTKIIGNHVTQQDGDYNNAATWLLGKVPGSLQAVDIEHDVVLTDDQTTGSMNIIAGGSLDLNGYTLTIDRGTILNDGTFTHNNGTVRFSRTGDQDITALNYGNLIIAGTGSKTLTGNINVNGNLTIYSNLDIDNTNDYTINIGGDWVNLGAFEAYEGEVLFNGSSSQEIQNNSNFYNLSLDNSADVTNTGINIINSILSIGDDATFTNESTITVSGNITGSNANSTFENAADAVLNISGELLGTGTLIASAQCNEVNYNNNGDQDIKAPSGNQYAALTLSAGGTKTAPAGDLYVSCDWTNNVGFDDNGGTVIFNGTNSQSLSGSSQTAFNSLTIDNASNVNLGNTTSVKGTLTLTDGDIVLGDNHLLLSTEASSISGGSASSYIQVTGSGIVRKVFEDASEAGASRPAFTYPVGDADYYTPLTFTLNQADLNNAFINVNTITNKHPDLDGAISYLERYWRYNQSGFSGTIDYDISVVYNDADLNSGGTEADMLPVKISGGTLLREGTINTSSNTLTMTAQSTFSDITGGDDQSVLPVEILDFYGYKQGENIMIEWATTSEINNDYFVVERSLNGFDFEKLTQVEAAGNSNAILSYSATDAEPFKGINYYRLKQVDFDGKFEYSDIIKVDYFENGNNGAKKIVKLLPNPIESEDLVIKLYGFNSQERLDIRVISPVGVSIYQKTSTANENGNQAIVLNNRIFRSKGLFVINVISNDTVITKKLIKD